MSRLRSKDRPEVEHIISDHAGTVLDEPEPEASLTRNEEKRVIQTYYNIVEDYAQYLYNKSKRIIPDGEEDEEDDNEGLEGTQAVNDSEQQENNDYQNEAENDLNNTDDKDDDGEDNENNENDGEEGEKQEEDEDEEIDEEAQRARQAAAARAAQEEDNRLANEARAKADQGLPLPYVKKALECLDMRMNEEQFKKHVVSFFEQYDLLDRTDGGLGLEGFIALISMVYAPGHKFGARLRKACCRADDVCVSDLISRGCNPLGHDGGGFTSLHYAAQSGHVSTCEYLLDYALNPPDSFVQLLPESPSIMTSPSSPTGSEKSSDSALLLDKEASGSGSAGNRGPYYKAMLEDHDNSGWTPLMVASSRGEVGVMNYLISCGADVKAYSKDSDGIIGRTALHWAATKGKVEALGVLIKAGADVNGVDASGWTPLHCALMHGHVTTASALITKFKADKNIEDRIGRTAEGYCSAEVWTMLDTQTAKKTGKGKVALPSTTGTTTKQFSGK